MTHLVSTLRLALVVSVAALAVSCGDDEDSSSNPGGGGDQTPRFQHYLRAAPYSKLVVELDVVPGTEPTSAMLTDMKGVLSQVLAKPGGITFTRHESLASRGANHAWTFDELDALANQTFNLEVPGDTVKMHVLFVDGHSAEDTANGQILGLAWAHTHLVMFKDTIRSTCGNHPSRHQRDRLCAGAERSIWTHETGHLLGLVDNGLPMQTNHRDPDPAHGRHDANTDCVMYWSYDGRNLVDAVSRKLDSGQDNIGFDDACLADLAAVRGN